MSLTADITRSYENMCFEKQSQNKPKTNPIQSQSKPKQSQFQTQFQPQTNPIHESRSRLPGDLTERLRSRILKSAPRAISSVG